MIEIKNLEKKYSDKIILRNINAIFNDNTLNVIMGESGSGKTTLLKLIALNETFNSGKIFVDGNDINIKSDKEKASYRNKHIGFVYQNYRLEQNYTVFENVEIPLIIAGVKKKERKEKVLEALELVNFSHRAEDYPCKLSGGEQQRVAIARAIVNNADIILADEPCGNLDKENSKNIYSLLEDLKRDKIIVIVTHDDTLIQGVDNKFILEDGNLNKC